MVRQGARASPRHDHPAISGHPGSAGAGHGKSWAPSARPAQEGVGHRRQLGSACGGPRVRIRLPPAVSLVRTWFCRQLAYPAPFHPAGAVWPPSAIRLRCASSQCRPSKKRLGFRLGPPMPSIQRADGDPVRLRARHIKRVHPAIRAEGVPRDAGTVLCGTSPSAREEDSSAKGTGGSNQSVR